METWFILCRFQLITNIHHPHDHVVEIQVCTRHNPILRFWSIWRSTLVVMIAKQSISASTKRKHGTVWFTKFRPQIDHQHPPPTCLYYRIVNLHVVYQHLKMVIHLTVHIGCHKCRFINLSKDLTQNWKRVIHPCAASNWLPKSTTNMITL